MKKAFLAAILCISVTIGLCACEGQSNGASTQNAQERDFVDMTEGYVPPKPVVVE